jgi:predicted amidohydrolase YtcJ
MRLKTLFSALFASSLLAMPAWAAPSPGGHVDRIFVNGRIWTGDDARPWAEAIAVSGDTLVGVGNDSDIKAMAASDTSVVNLGGRFVTPGFQDSHIHFPGPSINSVDLSDVTTLAQFQDKLKAFAAAHPDLPWIVGKGWGYAIFPNESPQKEHIDAVISDRPVYLAARDGHMGLANSAALRAAGVTASTQDPPNGHIMKARNGEPTGEFKEAAQGLIRKAIPADTPEVRYRTLITHLDGMAKAGLTAAHDAMSRPELVELFERALAANQLKLRLRFAMVMVPGVGGYSPQHHLERPITEADVTPYVRLRDKLRGPLLEVTSIKGVLDGTVDAMTAVMDEPYVGTDITGIPFWEKDELNQTVALYDKLGFQVMLHGIGDKAVAQALDSFAYAARVNGTTGRRHRIEHAEVPRLEDLKRFHDLGVIASTTPMFANPDETVLKNFDPLLGPKRAPHADSFKIFDDAGIVQAFSSDWDAFTYDVIEGIAVAVTRQTADGKPIGGWYPSGRISVEAALRHYTIDGAYATFDEAERGTLTKGKLADFVVLSQDLTRIDPMQIRKTKVLLTVMGGTDTWRSPDFR